MKTTILILGFLFLMLAIWALFEAFGSRRKSARKPQRRTAPPVQADPQSLIATDPYGSDKMRRGVRDTTPRSPRFH